ncbi:MAG: SusC/RagA family TonB-linked outer membrane protein [Mangrovibacterium sp.]
MKLTVLVLLLSILGSWASQGYTQTTRLTLEARNLKIEEFLRKIEEQSEYRFFYSGKIDVQKTISGSFENKLIPEVLDVVLKGTGIKYEIKGRQIILSPAEISSFFVESQQKSITGKVTDPSGTPLPGVSIVVKGTMTGVITDSDGNYSLSNIPANSILIFSFVGMRMQEIAVGNNTTINVTLTEETIGLEEVVAVGYGTRRKVTLTGSVVSASTKEIRSNPSISVTNTLAGILPGVTTLNRSGEPGRDNATILIRGLNTTGNTSPLVLVDNVEYADWQHLNSNDIESISVLKDASAAIYGARAGNGVILITTKRGTLNKPSISYTFNQGFSQPTRVADLASSAQFADYLNDYLTQNGQPPMYTEEEIQKFADGSDPINYPNVDWYHEVLKKTTPQSMHNLNVRGGTENVKYSVSGSYAHQTGMFKGGSHDFKTYSLRSNIDLRISQYIKVGFDMNAGINNGNYPPLSSGGASAYLYQLIPALPTMPVFWENGLPSPGRANANPRVLASDAQGNYNDRALRFQGRGNFDITIPWVKGLGIDGFAVFNNDNTQTKMWEKPAYVYNYDKGNNTYIKLSAFNSPAAPTLSQSYANNRNYLINFRIKYERQFGDHNINVFVAAEQEERFGNNFSARREKFATEAIDELFAGSLTNQTNSGNASETARQNVFGRFSYDFKSKYLLDFNFRYDGSANFPPGKRFGFFPGFLAAWRISEENFMNSFGFINELKLRGSYGQIGNDQVPAFQYLSTYSFSSGYNFGQTPTQSQGLVAGVSPNPNITWEVAELVDIGLNGIFWNGLLGFEIDVFKQTRNNILANRGLAVPAFAAISLPNENFGVVENKGFELQLSTKNNIGDFSYSVAANVAFSRNKVIDIAESPNVPEWQKQTGHVLGALKLYHATGIFRTEAELNSSPHMVGAMVGDLKYEDISDDGTINASDMILYDKSNIPEVTFGTQVSLNYKNFSLWANFAGQARAWVDGGYMAIARINQNSLEDIIVNRWRPGSMDSKYPRLKTYDTGEKWSTFWLKNAWFVRLKTLELGYDLPKHWLSKINIASMRVYVNGNNLFTLDELKWYDPEGISAFGDFYPQCKIYNLGFQITF